jgi:colanic acid biosynthesis protein WcaH
MNIPKDIYAQIVRLMPIPCVDLLVEDSAERLLLIRRANDPAKGQWWFPGGRVHYLETRVQAAKRKLKEECGLDAFKIKEIGTYDVILPISDDVKPSHAITTLFRVVINQGVQVTLNTQSLEFEWRKPEEWLNEGLHIFIRQFISITTSQYEDFKVHES